MSSRLKIAVLVSGGGTNLQVLIDSIEKGSLPGAEIVLVISSNKDAFALERASKAGIKTEVVTGSIELLKALEAASAELIVLAGYMSIVEPAVVERYRNRIINIHPSLIPKHCGEGFYGMRVHGAVLEAGDKVSGATVHFVDEGIDTGEIILQREVPVEKNDDEKTLAARVLTVEHQILPEAIRELCEKILRRNYIK